MYSIWIIFTSPNKYLLDRGLGLVAKGTDLGGGGKYFGQILFIFYYFAKAEVWILGTLWDSDIHIWPMCDKMCVLCQNPEGLSILPPLGHHIDKSISGCNLIIKLVLQHVCMHACMGAGWMTHHSRRSKLAVGQLSAGVIGHISIDWKCYRSDFQICYSCRHAAFHLSQLNVTYWQPNFIYIMLFYVNLG